ncbi:MAG: L-serine ammonia-lyase, iron-sulfur-dependent, subunit alpha [Bacteroidales bacterium]|nr:L-serine ammonia-lyase, iron-sulfur-dependent, subunit alpha [Bacteroidales bacterium]
MNAEERQKIKELINREVVVATGCTEPAAVALAVAKTRELLGECPEHTELLLSKNVYKNAMGVGIPGTGMVGLPIAVAVALVSGKSDKGLEVLSVPEADVTKAKEWLANNAGSINIGIKSNSPDKLYIECRCKSGERTATSIIAQRHNRFVYLARGEEVLLDVCAQSEGECCNEQNEPPLSARIVFDYATTAPFEELQFINETVKLNLAAAHEGMGESGKHYGLDTGRILLDNAHGDFVHTTVAWTVAASDARMSGCTLPVYSNSGSGNQGITCTLPVFAYGREKHCSEEQITRALIMSHLMSIYIKRGVGRLSAMCGITNASMGVAASITWLQGGSFEQVCNAMKNMVNTVTGLVCDGAKPSCALEIANGIYSAFVCAELALHDKVVDPCDGLAENDVDRSIASVGVLANCGMMQTDDVILDIMTHKRVICDRE